MHKRIIGCGLVVLLGLVSLPSVVPSVAQSVPTANAATIESFVQQRFEATQAYSAFGELNVTVDAAFALAQTATAVVPVSTATLMATPTQFGATDNPLPTASPVVTFDPLGLTVSEMVFIPAVEGFEMGTTSAEVAAAVNQCVVAEQGNCTVDMASDSLPVHVVSLAPFQIQRYEVTSSQYTAFLNTLGANSHLSGCEGNACAFTRTEDETALIEFDGTTYTNIGGNLPMYKVTWYGAKAFCEAAGGRLPTEAEWEYAARGTDGRIYPWGNTWDPLSARTSIPATTEVGPLPVGRYPSGFSPFGMFDMAGNVAEWVSDWYDPTYYTLPDASGENPLGPTVGTEKVIRGGSWDSKPFFARAVHRQSLAPQETGSWIGFRCADDAPAVLPTISPTFAATALPNAQATLPPIPTLAPSSTAAPETTTEATAAG